MTSISTTSSAKTSFPARSLDEHVTINLCRISTTNIAHTRHINMTFWDTFGLAKNRTWTEDSFRSLLHGSLDSDFKVGSDWAAERVTTKGSCKDRAHSLVLVVKATTSDDPTVLSRLQDFLRIATSEGYSPVVLMTHISDLNDTVITQLRSSLASALGFAQMQVYPMYNYINSPHRNSTIDLNSLCILDVIQSHGTDFITKCQHTATPSPSSPSPSPTEQPTPAPAPPIPVSPYLRIGALVVFLMLIWMFLRKKASSFVTIPASRNTTQEENAPTPSYDPSDTDPTPSPVHDTPPPSPLVNDTPPPSAPANDTPPPSPLVNDTPPPSPPVHDPPPPSPLVHDTPPPSPPVHNTDPTDRLSGSLDVIPKC